MNLVKVKTRRLVQVEKWHVKNLNAINKNTKYMSFGFTYIYVVGRGRPQYLLYMKILAMGSMKQSKLKGHSVAEHAECIGKTPEFFLRKLNEFNKQEQAFTKITSVTSESLLESF